MAGGFYTGPPPDVLRVFLGAGHATGCGRGFVMESQKISQRERVRINIEPKLEQANAEGRLAA